MVFVVIVVGGVAIVVVVYISLLEQLEASGVVSHTASFIYY